MALLFQKGCLEYGSTSFSYADSFGSPATKGLRRAHDRDRSHGQSRPDRARVESPGLAGSSRGVLDRKVRSDAATMGGRGRDRIGIGVRVNGVGSEGWRALDRLDRGLGAIGMMLLIFRTWPQIR